MLRFVFSLLLLTSPILCIDAAEKPKPDVPTPDEYGSLLPRIPAKSPREALKAFQTRDGFHMELVAAEPLIRDPVAAEFDENGRLFVVEMPGYNLHEQPEYHNLGAVKLLEDTNGDGQFDKSTVYVDKLHWPTAVACYDGGIFVGVTPHILYCKDTDGDGKADIREKVLTGFGADQAGEALLNSFRWGIDQQYHLSTSLSGGNVAPTDAQQTRPVSVRRRGLLFNPKTRKFELTSGYGQHGMSMDDWGHKFVCSNSQPIWMLMYDDRYLARNPYLQAAPTAVDIAPQGKYTKIYRTSAVEPWRVLRTKLRSAGVVRGSDEGGKPAGFFSAATGVTIYRGDAYPQQFRGHAFIGEVASNLIYRARLSPDGLRFKAERADPGADFVTSSDNWFRPAQFVHAPDGTLFVLDMYRELVETIVSIPPDINKHLDPASGIDRGRIYRIAPDNFQYKPAPELGEMSTTQLVALLEHQNAWHRDTASRLLYERADETAEKPLRNLVKQSENPVARATALYALDALDKLTEQDVLLGLKDAHAGVREHALRLAEKFVASSAAIADQFIKIGDDPSQDVQFQLAFSAGAMQNSKRKSELLADILKSRGADSWFRMAAFSSASGLQDELLAVLLSDPQWSQANGARLVLTELIRLIGAAAVPQEMKATATEIARLREPYPSLASYLTVQFLLQLRGIRIQKFIKQADPEFQHAYHNLIQNNVKTATDTSQAASRRVAAINTLRIADQQKISPLLTDLWSTREPASVQSAALSLAALNPQLEIGKQIMEQWPSFGPQLKAEAIETLLARPAWAKLLLSAVQKGELPRSAIDVARLSLLVKHPDNAIAQSAKTLLDSASTATRQKVVSDYQSALQLDGDIAKGKAIFKKTCSACHRLENVGTVVGPDLKAIRNRGLPTIVLNVFDPNRDVKPQYFSYAVLTEDGRVLSGMITKETANSITLRQVDGKTFTILRNEIEEMRSSGLSFMPEGLEKQLTPQAMADLLAYLNSIE